MARQLYFSQITPLHHVCRILVPAAGASSQELLFQYISQSYSFVLASRFPAVLPLLQSTTGEMPGEQECLRAPFLGSISAEKSQPAVSHQSSRTQSLG